MVMKTERIADTELGLLYRDRVFQKVLGPGVHRRLPNMSARTQVHKLDLRALPVRDAALEALYLTRPEAVAQHFVVADVADNELGLVFADGKLVDLVGPGQRAFYAKNLRQIAVRVLDAATEVEAPKELVARHLDQQDQGLVLQPGQRRDQLLRRLDLGRGVKDPALSALHLTRAEVVATYFVVADVADNQLGLVFADGKLVDLVGPGHRAFYAKGLREIAVQVIDLAHEVEAPAALVAPLARLNKPTLVAVAEVPADHVGLLTLDGVPERQLKPGRYAFYRAGRRVEVVTLDLRLQALEVTGQEVLTKDRIGIRANVTAVYRIADPAKAVSVAANLRDYLYKELQFALREAVGIRTLEEVLGDKQGINAAVAERLVPTLVEAGLEVPSVGIKDIILPGDVRELMNRVIEAEKTAQANVIKRREETAATRSLLNTAKLMEDNPILLRLKELEALEKVSEKVGNVIVGNGMDGVLEDLVRIRPRNTAKGGD